MSVNSLLLNDTISVYNQAKLVTNSTTGGVWDGLLSLIEGLVKKLLNTAIGANGQTINDIINDVKAKIAGVVTDVTATVNGIVTSLSTTINGVVTSVNDYVGGLVETVTGKVESVITTLSTIVNDVVTGVKGKIDEVIGGIGDTIERVVNALKDKIAEIITSITNIATSIGQAVREAIGGIGTFISNAVNDAIYTVSAFIGGIVEDVRNWIVDAYKNVRQWLETAINNVKDWITGIYNAISEWFGRTIQNLKDTYESVKGSIQEWIAKALVWLSNAKDDIVEWFWKTVTSIATWIKNVVIPKFDDAITGAQTLWKLGGTLFEMISSGNYQGAFDLLDNFAKGLGIPAPVSTFHAILSSIAYFWQSINLQFIPMQVAAARKAEISLALNPISTSEAATAVYKGYWKESDYLSNAAVAGQTRERAKAALEANRALPTPGQAQQLFLRGEINESEHDRILGSYGFSANHIREIKALYAVIPSVTDIITMAVKEAFTPDIAKRFGQYEDLPASFVSWAAKQGLSEDWAGRYWAAHWDLPSPQMGFTMYQRRIIERDDLKLLLKALDVMPFWREKLIDLSYNPPTRVDIRRMYKMGMLTEDQVYNFHLDIGYSPDNARMLTEFTKRYSAPEDQSQQDQFIELARGTYSSAYREHVISEEEYRAFLQGLKYNPDDVELLITLDNYQIVNKDKLFDPTSYRKDYLKLVSQGYNRGLFNRNDAKPLLVELGYSDDEAELELSLIDYNRTLSIKDSLISQLHQQYITFIIDEVDLHSIMDTFGFYASEIDRLIEEWGIERNFRDKHPSFTDLKGFYNRGLITLDNLLDELRGLGYHEKYISLYQQVLAKE